MASILRFSKHARRFSQLGVATRKISSIQNSLTKNGQLPHYEKLKQVQTWSMAARSISVQKVQTDYQRVDEALNRLDMFARRTGKISMRAVEQLLDDFKQLGKVNPNHSLLAIHCCGKLLCDETFETRKKIMSDIWNFLEKNDCTLDISHYNALIKVHFENEHKFDATDFLAKIESKRLAPNRVTFQRLISCYCQQGDIEGAGKILEHMKKESIPINEGVFNALILGHARANNMEGAKGVLDVMRTAKVQPSVDTYAALINAYAEKGDMQNISQVFEELEKADLYLSDEHYLDVIYYLARNGHSKHVKEITKRLRKFVGFNQDASTCILKLINCGQDEVALQLLDEMPGVSSDDGKVKTSGHFVIRQLVRNDWAVDKVLKVCKDLKQTGKNTKGIDTATNSALRFGRPDHAIAFIKEMRDEGLPVRTHYFWPILIHLKKQNHDESKLYDVIRMMVDYGCPANYATFVDYFYPNINTDNYEPVVNELNGLGFTFGAIVCPLIEHYLNRGQLDNAIALTKIHSVRVNVNKLFGPLARLCFEPSDATVDSVLNLLELVRDRNLMETQTDVFGQFALSYGRYVNRNATKIEFVLKKMQSRNLCISPEISELMQKQLLLSNNKAISELLRKMTMEIDGVDSPTPRQPREMNVEEMERHLTEARKNGLNTKGILSKLLMHYCRTHNVEKVEEIKAELDSLDYVYSEGILCLLMNLYANCDKLDDAKAIWQRIKENHPDVAIDELKLVDFAAALIRADEIDESLKFLGEQAVTKVPARRDAPIFRLLNAAAEKGDAQLTQKLFDVVVQRGLTEPNNVVLGPLIKVHILKGDLKGAVEKFTEICRNYRCAPWRDMLLEEFIKIDDAETVQKIIDECSAIYGEMNTMYDLAFAFLRCGRSREAKKIFDTSGVRARHGSLDHECQRLIERDDVETLEELVKVTRDLFDINRDRMYYHLLVAYDKRNDYENALDVWTLMQDEDLRPSERTLVFLADILKRNDQPVPFAVPEITAELATNAKSAIQAAIANNDLGTAMKINQANKLSNKVTTEHESRALIEALVQKERFKDAVEMVLQADCELESLSGALRLLLVKLAALGDTDNIARLEKKLSPEVKKRVQFNNTLIHSLISKDEPDAVLNMMQEDLGSDRSNPPAGILLPFLNKYPHLLEKVEELALGYAKHDLFGALNFVWVHCFANEKYDKADAIFKQTPRFQESLSFRHIVDHAKLVQNVDMLKRLVDVVKTTSLPSQATARVVSCLMDVQCALNQLDGAEATYKEAKTMGVDSLVHHKSVHKLRSLMTSAGRDTSFLPDLTSSSSESSDSDADQNKRKKTTQV